MLELLPTMVRQDKQNKYIQIEKKETLSFVDYIILYVENPKELHKKLMQLIIKFNLCKDSVTFLYYNYE